MNNLSKFSTTLSVGESLQVGEVLVTVAQKDGRRAKLEVLAPRTMRITRTHSNPSAQECASSPSTGKEHTHGKYPL